MLDRSAPRAFQTYCLSPEIDDWMFALHIRRGSTLTYADFGQHVDVFVCGADLIALERAIARRDLPHNSGFCFHAELAGEEDVLCDSDFFRIARADLMNGISLVYQQTIRSRRRVVPRFRVPEIRDILEVPNADGTKLFTTDHSGTDSNPCSCTDCAEDAFLERDFETMLTLAEEHKWMTPSSPRS